LGLLIAADARVFKEPVSFNGGDFLLFFFAIGKDTGIIFL
jgi:hypothetical protein